MAVFTMNMIGVTDLAPPVISHLEDAQGNTVSALSVDENSATGTVLGTVVADASAYEFAIVGGNSTFAISNTGQITVANNSALDYETTTSLSFQVTVSDYANNVSPAYSVTVNIGDVDDAPPTMTVEFGKTTQTEYPFVNTTLADFSATDTDGTELGHHITITTTGSQPPAGVYISNATRLGTKVKRIRANANQFLFGGVDTNTTFTITASVTGSNGISNSISHNIEVTDVTKITGGTHLGGPTASQLANFEASGMNEYFDAAVNTQTRLYLLQLNTNGDSDFEETQILEVDLTNGQFRNNGDVGTRDMPSIASGQLGSASDHRHIDHVWASGSKLYGLSREDDHNGYDAPCLWRCSISGATDTWDLIGQVSNWNNDVAGWPDGTFLGPDGAVYLYDRTSSGTARYEKLTGWSGSSAGSIVASDLPLNGITGGSFENGVAVCSHSGNDTIIFADNGDRVEVVDFVGSSSKVGDLVNVDDMDNLEAQISGGAPSLNLSSTDAIAGYGNYFYIFNRDSSHPNDYALYRFNVTNAHSSEP